MTFHTDLDYFCSMVSLNVKIVISQQLLGEQCTYCHAY